MGGAAWHIQWGRPVGLPASLRVWQHSRGLWAVAWGLGPDCRVRSMEGDRTMARLLAQKTKGLVMLSGRQHRWAGGRLGGEGQSKPGQAEFEASEARTCRRPAQYLGSLSTGDRALGMPASNRQAGDGAGTGQGAGEKLCKRGEETQGRSQRISDAERDGPGAELGRKQSRRVVGGEAAGHQQGQPLWGPDPRHPRPPRLSFLPRCPGRGALRKQAARLGLLNESPRGLGTRWTLSFESQAVLGFN